MAHIKTISNMLSHGLWRVRHDRSDLPAAAARLAQFSAAAAKKAVQRRIAATQKRYVVHAAIHTTGNNIGDMALPVAIRKVVEAELGPQHWYLQPLWRSLDAPQADSFNERASLMIVGGGGLLLRDNKPSGWQWNVDLKNLERLKVPMCLFAVGYNRFRGEEDFGQEFRDHIQLTTEKSVFVGLRNRGSLESVKGYLPASMHDKLRVQPCVTTVLSRFYPTYDASLRRPSAKELAINACFDRAEKRFAGDEAAEITKLIDVARWAHQTGWKIHLAYHAFEDAKIAPYLSAAGVPFERQWLPRQDPEKAFRFYTKIPLVLGMRGHAQMIPFGLGNMILPIITHNKLVYMLEEFGMSEWGVELSTQTFVSDTIERIKRFDEARGNAYAQLERAKDRLWNLTRANLDALRAYVS